MRRYNGRTHLCQRNTSLTAARPTAHRVTSRRRPAEGGERTVIIEWRWTRTCARGHRRSNVSVSVSGIESENTSVAGTERGDEEDAKGNVKGMEGIVGTEVGAGEGMHLVVGGGHGQGTTIHTFLHPLMILCTVVIGRYANGWDFEFGSFRPLRFLIILIVISSFTPAFDFKF